MCIVRVEFDDPQKALRLTLQALLPHKENYRNVMVIYCGENLPLFHYNLPCDNFEINKIKDASIKVIDGIRSDRDLEVAKDVFSSIVQRLLDPSPVKNLREISAQRN